MSDSRNEHHDSAEDFQTEPLTEHAGTKKGSEQQPPEDKHNLIYIIFFLYGIGILLPFNAVTTAFDFFIDKVSSSYLPLIKLLCIRCLATFLRAHTHSPSTLSSELRRSFL